MIFHHKLTTKAGTFSYISTQKLTSPHINLLFFTAMGIGCSYFDFYGLVNELPQTINCLCVDLLGSGSSSQPHNLKRNSQNIVQEITIFLNQLPLNEVYLCCHSFSSLYLLATLHQATLNTNIKGFISIDPTTVEIMKSYTDPFQDSLEESQPRPIDS
ncbi:alpha/beta fold hydrolase [Bombilactobacillus folatiphilus]|uniref:Alpha/beta fold hydrolase n=1 Tax=Bombilactobacillus folatiphilus TaxID=2923362 RepID=A0ABY4PB79_9LACO|nr:alpha/beta fold hydrolase [Bombilactobacillus folatiphilus]UQS82809.1 alpha/beta fold hydrolase [Bombilactobacillus folatiphilus]